MKVIARWESRGGAHYCELQQRDDGSYVARGDGCSYGVEADNEAEAITTTEPLTRAGEGIFAPDVARTDMVRVL